MLNLHDVKSQFAIFFVISLTFAIHGGFANAARFLNNSQLKYVFNNTEMMAFGGTCIGTHYFSPVQFPVETNLMFENGGAVSIVIRCLADSQYGPWTITENGEWYVENGFVCIESSGEKYPSIHSYEGETCWRVKEARFGLTAFNARDEQAWRLDITQHPKHATKEKLLVALKGIEDAVGTSAQLEKQKAALAELLQKRKEQEMALAELQRKREEVVSLIKAPSTPRKNAKTEGDLWERIYASNDKETLESFLERFPQGRYAGEATAKIAILKRFKLVEDVDFGRYHALVIGINNYEYLQDLGTAIKDAKAIASVLKNEYGFKVTLLENPSRSDIVEAFDDLRETLTSQDNLVIYYAGHGWQDVRSDQGYWLPSNAKPNRRTNWVSNGTLVDTLKSLTAKHVMVVADSCFSGTLVRSANVGFETADYKSGDYWRRMAMKQTRVALVSGGLEPVTDDGGSGHSPFAKAFIDALSENKTVIDGTALFNKLRRPVMVAAQQTPQYSDVRNTGHDGGDFYL